MATHSSILAWRIPWTEEPGGLQSSPVQFSRSVVSDSLWPHGLQHARLPCPSLTPRAFSNSCSLSRWCHPNHLIHCCLLLLLSSIFPSIRVFSKESALPIRWPKYWSFSFSISPSNEYSGLISSRIDWLDLRVVQGTLKSLLHHHSTKASVLQGSAFFMAQLSYPYTTTGKTIALTRWTFVGKVMSLLFIMLSRLVTAFLPRSKRLLISWLQSPSTVILETKKIKSVTVSIVSPSICHEVREQDATILVFWMLSFKPTFSLSSFTFIKRLFNSSLLSAIRVVSSAYLRLLIFLPAILIPACASSSPAFHMMYSSYGGFPHSSVSKSSACNAGDPGSISGSGRSPGEGNGNPLQYSCLENPMDRGAWWATVYGIERVGHNLGTKPPPLPLCI